MNRYSISSLLGLVALAAPVLCRAEEAAAAATEQAAGNGPSYNPVMIGLVSLLVILLFAIAMVGNVVRQLSIVYREKLIERKNKPSSTAALVLLALLSLGSLPAFAEEAAAAVAPAAPAQIGGMAADTFYLLISAILFEILVLMALMWNVLLLLRLIRNKPELVPAARAIVKRSFLDRFNKSVALELEKDIELDHDYDGIRELDNSLPPWWKYGFYLTIIVAVVYMGYYHMGSGPSSTDEFVAEMEKGEADKKAYLAKSANNVDENTVKYSSEPAELSAGEAIFQTTCAACHAKDGGGGVGPNLADDYWLHGGSIQDIFKSIKYGWQDKGMKSWKDDFSPKQIAQISSYVKSLKGTTPAAPKEKQGELYQETTQGPAADSTTANTSVMTKQ